MKKYNLTVILGGHEFSRTVFAVSVEVINNSIYGIDADGKVTFASPLLNSFITKID